MTSSKQIAANRRNAVKSTGPKNVSSTKHNALKHGILASQALLVQGPGKEDSRAFKKLLDDLCSDLKPEGTMERSLVEKAAIDLWRLRRLFQAEKGQLLEGFYEVTKDAKRRLDSYFQISQLSDDEGFFPPPPHQSEKLLERRKEQLELIKTKSLPRDAILKELAVDPAVPDGELYDAAQKACEGSIRFNEFCIDFYDAALEVEEGVLKDKRRIPRDFDVLLRYDTTITRNLFKTLRELDRLQKIRMGEFIPTLDINLDKPD